jgi:hypothetical protein
VNRSAVAQRRSIARTEHTSGPGGKRALRDLPTYPSVTITKGCSISWTTHDGKRHDLLHGSAYWGWFLPDPQSRHIFRGYRVGYDGGRRAAACFDFTAADARRFPAHVRSAIFRHAAAQARRYGATVTGEDLERWFMEPDRMLPDVPIRIGTAVPS